MPGDDQPSSPPDDLSHSQNTDQPFPQTISPPLDCDHGQTHAPLQGDSHPDSQSTRYNGPPHGRRKPSGQPDKIIDILPIDKCSTCGGEIRISGVSSSSRIDYVPAHYITIQVNKPKCTCKDCGKTELAPEPDTFVLPNSLMGNGLLAQVVVDKYADNIPLNRQCDRFNREDLKLSVSLLCQGLRRTAELCAGVVKEMTRQQKESDHLQGDGTGIPVLQRTRGKVVQIFGNPDSAERK